MTPRRLLPLCALVPVLAGCDNEQSTLAPKSHQAKDIASLFWWMMAVSWFGIGLVVLLILIAWRKAHRRPGHDPKEGERLAFKVVIGAGIVMPIALIAALFVVSDLFVIRITEAPAKSATRLTILVVGHQWWWEVRYPGTSVVTANEIHLPVNTPVRLEVRTADVIHSFWVPRLNRTIDAIPGRTNAIELDADATGVFRGQCEEFCGLQHAHMVFYVYAQTPTAFAQWLSNQKRPARPPATAAARQGEKDFMSSSCSNCHAIRGTPASGDVGPDLTHLRTRATIGAGTLLNSRSDLAQWIADSQHFKPGNEMPQMRLRNSELHALVTYLEGLK
ncbi:MAG TPA: cytochrome c oxidase subunit II [Gaiellaceae bacterium]|nr:cytochrome c oxidase subunit II [Gaiellaceae bacterium]